MAPLARRAPRLVVTSNVGERHIAAARALTADLDVECDGVEVAVVDALAILGPVTRFVLPDAYSKERRIFA